MGLVRSLTDKEQRQVDEICETVDQHQAAQQRQPQASIIWSWIWFVLVFASVATIFGMLYDISTTYYGRLNRLEFPEFAVLVGLILNLTYLIFGSRPAPRSVIRLRRLISLWFDAKEAELR
jgi:hypothetical protein